MKNAVLGLFMFMAMCLTVSVQAETAILCGNDLQAIDEDDNKAIVHVDFNGRSIKSKAEVKFLNVLGKEQKVVSAKMIGAQIEVRTKKESYRFDGLSEALCDGSVDNLLVTISGNATYPCACYED